MAFKVVRIVNENTLMVYPEWRMRKLNKGGKYVRLFGYKIPDKNKSAKNAAISTLAGELLGKDVTLENPRKLTPNGYVICDVLIGKKNVKDFFPEFQSDKG